MKRYAYFYSTYQLFVQFYLQLIIWKGDCAATLQSSQIFPDLSSDDNSVIDDMKTNGLRVRVITWNMCARAPPPAVFLRAKLLPLCMVCDISIELITFLTVKKKKSR